MKRLVALVHPQRAAGSVREHPVGGDVPAGVRTVRVELLQHIVCLVHARGLLEDDAHDVRIHHASEARLGVGRAHVGRRGEAPLVQAHHRAHVGRVAGRGVAEDRSARDLQPFDVSRLGPVDVVTVLVKERAASRVVPGRGEVGEAVGAVHAAVFRALVRDVLLGSHAGGLRERGSFVEPMRRVLLHERSVVVGRAQNRVPRGAAAQECLHLGPNVRRVGLAEGPAHGYGRALEAHEFFGSFVAHCGLPILPSTGVRGGATLWRVPLKVKAPGQPLLDLEPGKPIIVCFSTDFHME